MVLLALAPSARIALMSPPRSGRLWPGGVPTLAKLVLITGAGVVGLVVFIELTFVTAEHIKVGGRLYRDAVASHALTADILPPPLYAIESYLLALELRQTPPAERQQAIRERLAGLRAQYDERVRHWTATLAEDDGRRRVLLDEVAPSAEVLLAAIEGEVVPASRRGNAEALGRIIDGPLAAAYQRHRTAIDHMVAVTTAESAAIERAVMQDVESTLGMLTLVAAVVAVTVAAIGIISARSVKRAEDALTLRSAALNAAGNAIMIADRNGTIEWVNPAWCALTGYAADEAIGRNPRFLKSGAQDDAFYQSLWTTILAGRVWDSELVNLRKDGTRYYEQETITPVADAAGEVTHFIAIKQDITARRLADEALQRKNQLLAAVSEGLTAYLERRDWSAAMGALLREALRQTASEYGFVGVMMDGGPLRVLVHEGFGWHDTVNRELFDGALRAYAEQGYFVFTSFDNLFGHALRTGEVVMANDPATDPRSGGVPDGHPPLRCFLGMPIVQAGAAIGIIGVANRPGGYSAEDQEVLGLLVRQLGALCDRYRQLDRELRLEAERREVEQRLQLSEEAMRAKEQRFRSLIEHAHDLITVVDANGVARFQSPSSRHILGYAPDEITGRPVFEFVHPDDVAKVKAGLTRAQAEVGQARHIEARFRRADGAWRTLEVIGRRMIDGGEPVVVVNARDITDRRTLEEQFRQAQKMEAIGQLAGGVAHDFNNILLAMMTQVELSLMAPSVPDEIRHNLGEIGAAAERAAGLTRQLLAFGRRQVMQPRQLDVNESIRGLSRMLHRILGEDVQLQLDLHPAPLVVRADAGMLDQVLMNLAVNARDAMPKGGRLVIATGPRSLAPEEAERIPDASSRSYVSVRVTDTGSGIAPEHLPHIFEPFFTTKGVGKGTGLGLATVFGIARQHRGSVAVRSEVGAGTTFEVLLPASDAAPDEVAPGAAPALQRGAGETILVVEDEPDVRLLTVAVLERYGYRAIAASSGADAIGVAGRHAGAVDLLFTDLVMPGGMKGWELAEQLQASRPGLKVIFTSGYSADLAGRELVIEEGRNFLQKPYSIHQLLDVVRRSLDG